MFWTLALVLFIVGLVVFAGTAMSQDEIIPTVGLGGLALFILLVLAFVVAPQELGLSRVPENVEDFSKRLDAGKVYSVTATEDVNGMGEKILLVKEVGSQKRTVIHVKVFAQLPERWTLINGRPMEVK